jgi:hypothetical protein
LRLYRPGGFTLVERLSKGVRAQTVKDEFPGGCQLFYKWNGQAIEMDSIKENAIATPLSRILSGAGNMASGNAATVPGEPNEKQVKLKQTFINGLLVCRSPRAKRPAKYRR